MLAVSANLAQMITSKITESTILKIAKEEGMTTMMDDGVEKAKQGLTTLDEVIRVAYTV